MTEFIDSKRRLNYTWEAIAKMLGWSSRTLRRWKRKNAYLDPRELIDDATLDAKVERVVTSLIMWAQSMFGGVLQGEGYRVTRERDKAFIVLTKLVSQFDKQRDCNDACIPFKVLCTYGTSTAIIS